MWNRWFVVLLAIVLGASSTTARAQTIYADRFGLVTGPCLITSGAGDPTNTVNGNRCDTYLRTDTGDVYTKQTAGFTATGWGIVPRLTAANTWTANQTIANAAPALALTATGAGANLKSWAVGVTGTAWTVSTLNDALATVATPFSIDRSGNASILGGAAIGGNATIGGTAGITGAVTLGSTIGTATYASQITGWQIDHSGAADFRYLFTNELRATLFTAEQETVLAGSERVTKSYSTIAQPFTCPALGAAGPVWVFDASTYGDAPVFQAGDFVVVHILTRAAFGPFTITDCVGSVTAYADGTGANAGQQTWTFTRPAGANGGAMTGGTVVPVNQLVQDLGVSGNGYVELSAVDGPGGSNAPYLQTNTWTTSPTAANTTTQCRFGNMAGITSSVGEYGIFCGAFLPNGPFFRLTTTAFELRNLPITMYNAGVNVFYVNPGVPSLAMGNPIPASFGGGNTGFWMGRDTADNLYKLRIGNPAGNRLTWNGSQLSIVGEGSGITNINGGNIQAGTITAAQLNITSNPGGAALNQDPNTSDPAAWVDQQGQPPAQITAITDGVVGNSSLRSQVGTTATPGNPRYFPIDSHKTYRLHVWVRRSADSTGSFYGGLGTSGGGGYITLVWGVQGAVPGTTWTEYNLIFTPNMFPAGMTSANVLLDLNYYNAPGYMEAQDIRFEEVVPSTLIKDGAITTNKIQAGAITADQIAANTITVANLNASGFGDNLIKNSTFEGPPSQALAGWMIDPVSGGTMTQGCCGTRGPGTLLITPTGTGNYSLVLYYAVPVTIGAPYRVALDVYAGTATANGLYVRMFESNSNAAPRYVGTSTFTTPDVPQDSATDLYANGSLVQGWNHLEFVYTPPSPVHWVSFGVYDYTGVTGTFQALHLDGVEMEAQIGPGSIRANSITAGQIAAGTITGDRIAARTIISGNIATGTISANEIGAGTITATQIAANTITGNKLVANTITSAQIGVGAIVAGNIASGTITATQIAANTITADRMSISALSAITANLGAVTAGSLNAITITGSTITGTTVSAGCATMDSNGITLSPGGGMCNWYKWSSGGAGLSADGGAWMYLQAQNVQILSTSSNNYLNVTSSDVTLHSGSDLHLTSSSGNFNLQSGTINWSGFSGGAPGGSGYVVCVNTSGNFYRGTISTSNGGYCT
jgi:hypothetical protein